MRVDGSSNDFLATIVDIFNSVVPHEGAVTGTYEIKAKVTAYGYLIVLFSM